MLKYYSLLSFFLASSLSAATTSGSLFLTLPTNASRLTLGNSADLQGVEGIEANPASTVAVDKHKVYSWQATLSFFQLTEGVQYGNIGYSFPISKEIGNIGFALTYLSYGAIPSVDQNGILFGTASAYDFSGLVNYSRMLPGQLQAGVNVKIINQRLDSFNATGFAGDIGLKRMFLISHNPMWVAVAVSNLGTSMSFEQEGSSLPLSILASLSFAPNTYLPRWLELSGGPQFVYLVDGTVLAGGGFEARLIFLGAELYTRAKYQSGTDLGAWSLGGGASYRVQNIEFDMSAGLNPFGEFGNGFLVSFKIAHRLFRRNISMRENELSTYDQDLSDDPNENIDLDSQDQDAFVDETAEAVISGEADDVTESSKKPETNSEIGEGDSEEVLPFYEDEKESILEDLPKKNDKDNGLKE